MYNDYPLAPEITHNMLSKYCSNTVDEYGTNIGGVNKLVPNLGNNSKYVFYYRNLQLHLSLGMKLKILKFKQSDFNTDKRKNAASSFGKIFLN